MMPLLLENLDTPFTALFGQQRGSSSHPHARATDLTPMQVRFLGAAARNDLQHNNQGFFVRNMFKVGVDSFDDDSIGHDLVASNLLTLPVSTPKFYKTDCQITENGSLALQQAREEWAPQGWSEGVVLSDPKKRLATASLKQLVEYARWRLEYYDENILGAPDKKGLEAEFYLSGIQAHAFAVLVHNLKNWTIMGAGWSDEAPYHIFTQTPTGDDFIASGWETNQYNDARPMTLQEIDFLVVSGELEPMELSLASGFAQYLTF